MCTFASKRSGLIWIRLTLCSWLITNPTTCMLFTSNTHVVLAWIWGRDGNFLRLWLERAVQELQKQVLVHRCLVFVSFGQGLIKGCKEISNSGEGGESSSLKLWTKWSFRECIYKQVIVVWAWVLRSNLVFIWSVTLILSLGNFHSFLDTPWFLA